MNNSCNIGNNERIARVLIGAVLFLGAVLGLGRGFLFLMGIVLLVEGFIGWCATPIIVEKFKLQNLFKDNKQP